MNTTDPQIDAAEAATARLELAREEMAALLLEKAQAEKNWREASNREALTRGGLPGNPEGLAARMEEDEHAAKLAFEAVAQAQKRCDAAKENIRACEREVERFAALPPRAVPATAAQIEEAYSDSLTEMETARKQCEAAQAEDDELARQIAAAKAERAALYETSGEIQAEAMAVLTGRLDILSQRKPQAEAKARTAWEAYKERTRRVVGFVNSYADELIRLCRAEMQECPVSSRLPLSMLLESLAALKETVNQANTPEQYTARAEEYLRAMHELRAPIEEQRAGLRTLAATVNKSLAQLHTSAEKALA